MRESDKWRKWGNEDKMIVSHSPCHSPHYTLFLVPLTPFSFIPITPFFLFPLLPFLSFPLSPFYPLEVLRRSAVQCSHERTARSLSFAHLLRDKNVAGRFPHPPAGRGKRKSASRLHHAEAGRAL